MSILNIHFLFINLGMLELSYRIHIGMMIPETVRSIVAIYNKQNITIIKSCIVIMSISNILFSAF